MVTNLLENHFIHEEYRKDPYPLKFWSLFVTLSLILIYAVSYFAEDLKVQTWQQNPFLRVTNREFSLFLWQNPEHMRVHAKSKIGYLPGFQYLHKINMDVETSENAVTVPPDILFLYHTWNRLVGSYSYDRKISVIELKEFLNLVDEWRPENWQDAPKEYGELVQFLHSLEVDVDLDIKSKVPFEVRQAFYGWKNYFKEGEAINAFKPTALQMEVFLEKYPNYTKNYWKNIYPDYLDGRVPSFVLVALYNEYND